MKKGAEMSSIWKDPKVELPKIGKRIYCYGYCKLNKEYYSHKGYRFNESTFSFENDLDYDVKYFNELIKWCYEDSLIQQALNNK